MNEFLSYWQLRERPFEATWDTRFFYGTRQHVEALNRLVYLVSEATMNLGLLTGDIGCGKTLTRSVFKQWLDLQKFCPVVVENSGFPTVDLLGGILRQLDPASLEGITSKFDRCERLRQVLERITEEGKHTVLLLDEAQDMPQETMREVRWLTNFNGGGRAQITLILVGQPNLRPLVQSEPAINQRISLRFHLTPLTREDMPGYLSHRLTVAGHPSGWLFTDGAAESIHRATRGVPREANRLAKLALEHAWVSTNRTVGEESVDAVVEDLSRHQALPV